MMRRRDRLRRLLVDDCGTALDRDCADDSVPNQVVATLAPCLCGTQAGVPDIIESDSELLSQI